MKDSEFCPTCQAFINSLGPIADFELSKLCKECQEKLRAVLPAQFHPIPTIEQVDSMTAQ